MRLVLVVPSRSDSGSLLMESGCAIGGPGELLPASEACRAKGCLHRFRIVGDRTPRGTAMIVIQIILRASHPPKHVERIRNFKHGLLRNTSKNTLQLFGNTASQMGY